MFVVERRAAVDNARGSRGERWSVSPTMCCTNFIREWVKIRQPQYIARQRIFELQKVWIICNIDENWDYRLDKYRHNVEAVGVEDVRPLPNSPARIHERPNPARDLA